MKRFGLIGGIGPASTAKYYTSIVDSYRVKLNTEEYPDFTIRSINMTEMLRLIFSNDLPKLTDFLLSHIHELTRNGIEFSALASNTPHIVFDEIQKKSKIPLISIVEETCKAIKSTGIKTVGLFGTKSTMETGFYQHCAKHYGIEMFIPQPAEVNYIHAKYFEELVFNKVEVIIKSNLVAIVEQLRKNNNIEGLVLGGTELSLILNQTDFDNLTVFDTTQVHVQSIVSEMISD